MENETGSLADLQKSNQARLAKFSGQGVNIQLPPAPMDLLMVVIERLIGPQDSEAFNELAREYETRLSGLLDQTEEQIARAKLLAPGPQTAPLTALNGGRR